MTQWHCATHRIDLTIDGTWRQLTGIHGQTQGCALTQNRSETWLRDLATEKRARRVSNARGIPMLEQIMEVIADA